MMNSKRKRLSARALISLMLVSLFIFASAGAEVAFPPTTLSNTSHATSVWTTTNAYTGFYSVHLNTSSSALPGNESRFVTTLSSGITLGDINTVSWKEFLVSGYPPHVDIILDIDGDTVADDALVFEYAYNGHITEAPKPYGALTGFWYQTFSDDGLGPSVIDGTSTCWLTSGPAGGAGIIWGTLNAWKSGGIIGGRGINATTSVLRLEFEIDNWLMTSEAFLDDVEINGLNIMGIPGPAGADGTTGPQGEQGPTGPQGPIGLAGVDGINGTIGPQGIKGDQGDTGPRGTEGRKGDTGSRGNVGATGQDGPIGPEGQPGETGPQGESGELGFNGSIGLRGPEGPTGSPGEAGSKGETGDKGDPGIAGPEGEMGLDGVVPVWASYGTVLGAISLIAVAFLFVMENLR